MKPPYTFSVAISFCTEDEQLARELKQRIEPRLTLPVFIFTERQRELTGKSVEDALSPVFERQSRIAVVLNRLTWGKTGGTLVEYRAINRRRVRSDERFLFLIALQKGVDPPPWSEDMIYHDLTKYPLEDAAAAIVDMVAAHEQAREIEPLACGEHLRPAEPWTSVLRERLIAEFTSLPGIFQGYFGGAESIADARIWQSDGGEQVDFPAVPKLPYYHTYWAYEAAKRIAPDYMARWAPLTLKAISRHFGIGRWLRVARDYSFADGPGCGSTVAETVRHTTRAAEVVHLLSARDRRVSEVAWELMREADGLQQADGGWLEFREDPTSVSLWSTIYVYRFLSKLVQQEDTAPDERESFLTEAIPRLQDTEHFLSEHWRERRWVPSSKVGWVDGATAVLAEIGGFTSSEDLILSPYYALRATLTPAGRLTNATIGRDSPPEAVQVLRLAFALQNAGPDLAKNDSRYRRAVEWMCQTLDVRTLKAYDLGFAVGVLDVGTGGAQMSA